jgi:branched-subunit amino acid aminotransferase/4-amino-4-deoxychorismate lyase
MLAYLNGEYVPLDSAKLHVSDLAVQRGYGIFDFFRVSASVPLYLEDYLDRFFRSAAHMGLSGMPDRITLRAVVHELIQRNGMQDAGMKLILTGGYSPDAYHPVKGNFLVSQHALTLPSKEQVQKGIHIITHSYRRELSEVKTINYVMGVWLLKKMDEAGAADVLYHQDGLVSEFPRCNFFLVTRDGKVVTPEQHVLHGITRMRVLEAAPALGEVEIRPVALEEVYKASEAFLTSTTKSILPIVQVDNRPVGNGMPGPVTLALRQHLAKRELAEIEKTPLTA